MKKVLSILFVLLVMGVIFYFSSENGDESSDTSNGVIKSSVKVAFEITGKEYDDKLLEHSVKKLSFPVRKLAHFSIFLLLGVAVINLLNVYKLKKRIILKSIIICVLYACSDEYHQSFSSGRGPSIVDVGIDSFGSLIGIYLYYLSKITLAKNKKSSNIQPNKKRGCFVEK